MKTEASIRIMHGDPCEKCKRTHDSLFRGRVIVVKVCPSCKMRLCITCLQEHVCPAT